MVKEQEVHLATLVGSGGYNLTPGASGGGGGGGFTQPGGDAAAGPDGPVKGGDGGDGITVTIPGSPLAVAGGGGGAGAHAGETP